MDASFKVRAYAPGRTELAGNHTDHQGGKVVAATIDRGVALELDQLDGPRAVVESEGFDPFEIDLADDAPRERECGTTAALVRGVVACLRAAGLEVGGFALCARSDIPAGSGLSSSAAFELALAAGLCKLFGEGRADLGPLELARIGQEAERRWFGKPCGLMDQLSIALGGINLMDFGARSEGGADDVAYEPIQFDFDEAGYAIFLVDAHCDHSLYTDEYAQVARDMDAVARFMGEAGQARREWREGLRDRPFGGLACAQGPSSQASGIAVPAGAASFPPPTGARRPRLCDFDGAAYLASFEGARKELGDLAALRGLHYFHEMGLVARRASALQQGRIGDFIADTRRSGASSAQYLQNVSVAGAPSQPAMVALALADYLVGEKGAARIHGGGFGGTVQAFCPAADAERFAQSVDAVLGVGSCRRYRISSEGAKAKWAQ